jgi:hypothetical protein
MADTNKVRQIVALLEARKKALEEKAAQAEIFISQIEDAKIRTLLTSKYIEGKSWEEAGNNFYWRMTKDAARMSVKRFFEKTKSCSPCSF